MKFAPRALAGLAIALSVAGLALAGCQKPGDDAFGKRVNAYLMAHPEVIREAAVKLAENDRLAAAKASAASLSKYRAQLERDPRDFVANPGGSVTVVEFFDYRCGYCKAAAPEVMKLIQENPDVRFVLKEFPIFHQVSDTAAQAMLTPQAKAKGLDLYQALMREPALNDASLDRILAANGLDPAATRAAGEQPAIKRQILDTRGLASALKIDGTPAFIIGDTMIPGADIAALKAAITQAKGGGLKHPSYPPVPAAT